LAVKESTTVSQLPPLNVTNPMYVDTVEYVCVPLTTPVRGSMLPAEGGVESPQSMLAVVPLSVAVHEGGLSTGPEKAVPTVGKILSPFASAAGATASIKAATAPTNPAVRRIKTPFFPLMLCTPNS
jgi:hypothetical protein